MKFKKHKGVRIPAASTLEIHFGDSQQLCPWRLLSDLLRVPMDSRSFAHTRPVSLWPQNTLGPRTNDCGVCLNGPRQLFYPNYVNSLAMYQAGPQLQETKK